MTSLALACVLIAIGLYGLLTRRDLVAVLAAIEIMLGGAQLLLATYAAGVSAPAAAQGVTVIVLATVAAEASVGLALLVALVRRNKTRTDQIEEVRG
jgi:NADH:ubiquinone oxidoreductase subunit K